MFEPLLFISKLEVMGETIERNLDLLRKDVRELAMRCAENPQDHEARRDCLRKHGALCAIIQLYEAMHARSKFFARREPDVSPIEGSESPAPDQSDAAPAESKAG